MKNNAVYWLLLVTALLSCSKESSSTGQELFEEQEMEKKSNEKQILSFTFQGIENNGITVDMPGEIDLLGRTIGAEMPPGTDITFLEPEVEISENAAYEPVGPQDFSQPVNYTVTAEDGTSSKYLVTIEVMLSQKEVLLKIAEANPMSLLEWDEEDNISDWPEVVLDSTGSVIVLFLVARDLYVLPPEIGQLDKLKRSRVNDNSLDSIPPEIGQLSSLEILTVDKNSLTSIPPEIGQLNNLTFLNLFGNFLTSIPAEIGQLSNLEILTLDRNSISLLPPEIGQLSNLVNFTLDSNNLDLLPPEIGQLTNLDRLSIRDNQLISLPDEIGQLINLTVLNLNNNSLTNLPMELSQLTNLRFLDLGSNEIGSLFHIPLTGSGVSVSCESNLSKLILAYNKQPMILDDCICMLDKDNGGTVDIDIVVAADPNNPNLLVTCQGDIIGNKS